MHLEALAAVCRHRFAAPRASAVAGRVPVPVHWHAGAPGCTADPGGRPPPPPGGQVAFRCRTPERGHCTGCPWWWGRTASCTAAAHAHQPQEATGRQRLRWWWWWKMWLAFWWFASWLVNFKWICLICSFLAVGCGLRWWCTTQSLSGFHFSIAFFAARVLCNPGVSWLCVLRFFTFVSFLCDFSQLNS